MPDLLARLAEADPARGRRLPEATRAAVLDRVCTTLVEPAAPADRSAPAHPTAARSRPARRLRSRRTLALTAVLVLALAGAGVATYDFGQTPEQVERDYARMIRTVPLPVGYDWPGAMVDEDAHYAGRRAALMQATAQASCAWWDHWLAAAERGDSRAMALALDGQVRVFELTPRHPRNASEDVGGLDGSSIAYIRGLIADAEAGRTGRIASYVDVNCSAALERR